MATEVNKTIIELIYKGDQADRGAKKTALSFTELNQGLELAKKGLDVLRGAFNQVGQTVERGLRVDNLIKNFERLNVAVGDELPTSMEALRNATQGLVSDTAILEKANEALTLGLSPQTFEQVTEAATKLSVSMGKDVADGVGSAVTAIARQSTLMLDNLGVTLKVSEAQELYAQKLGVATDALTEKQKAEAFGVIAADKLIEASKGIAEVTDNAGLEYIKASNSLQRLIDEVSRGISKSPELAKAFRDLGDRIGEIDTEELIENLSALATIIVELTDLTLTAAGVFFDFGKGISDTIVAAVKEVESGFKGTREAIKEFVTGEKEAIEQLKEREKRTESLNKVLGDFELFVDGGTKAIEEQKKAQEEGVKAVQDYAKGLFESAKQTELGQKATELFNVALEASKKKTKGAGEGVEELSDKAGDAAEKIRELRGDLDRLDLVDAFEGAERGLEKAIEQGSAEGFDTAMEKAEETFKKLQTRELTKKYGDAWTDAEIADRADKDWQKSAASYQEKHEQAIDDAAQKQEEAFEKSASFFGDLIFDAMNNSFRDFEDIGKRVLADVGGSFLAGLTGGVGGAGGIEGQLSGIGKTFGQKLASGLTDALGEGVEGDGGIFGNILGNFKKGFGGLFGGSEGAAPGGSLLSSIGLPLAAIGGTIATGSVIKDTFEGKESESSGGLKATLSGGLIGGQLALLGGGLGGLFGGGNQERIQRENALDKILDRLEENTGSRDVGGAFGGSIGFDSSDFNIDFGSGGLAEQLIPSTSVLAQLFSGGSSKIKDDLTGIFSNALAESGSFNEALLNLSSLFDDLGIDAEEAKDQFKETFLDGEISIGEFGGAIQNLNQIASDNLIGEGSINEALNLLTKNFDNPRAQLKSLEILFNEAKEVGVTSISQLGESLTDRLGPEAKEVFAAIEAAGVTSFEDLESRSADEIFLILSQLSRLEDELQGSFDAGFGGASSAAAEAAEGVKRGTDEMVRGIEQVKNAAVDASKAISNLNNQKVKTPEDLNKNLGA